MADAVNIFPPGFRVPDTDGVPVSGGTVEFYVAGTSDAKKVYADRTLSTSLGSTVYLDSAGYPVVAVGSSTKTLVYTDTDPYKIIIKDADGVTLATHDNVVGAVVSGSGSSSSGITEAAADARYMRNPVSLASITNIDDADYFGLWDTSASANKRITWADYKTDLLSEWQATGTLIPVGTRQTFQQTTPPVGYNKETGAAYNDAMTRFTTGTVGTGGTTSASTVFASRTFTGTVGSTSLTEANLAVHNHDVNTVGIPNGLAAASGVAVNQLVNSGTRTSANAGSGTSHTHSLTMTAADFNAKYVSVCIGEKT